MPKIKLPSPITSLVYGEGREVDPVIRKIVDVLMRHGHNLAGFLQVNQPRTGRLRCDMILEELASGERLAISEDRGPAARGCRLDFDEFVRSTVLAMRALESGPDLLVINKFGKIEAQGGGFRSLIAEAISRDVPVLIAVPSRNLESWRHFSGGLAADHQIEALPEDAIAACRHLGFMTKLFQDRGVDMCSIELGVDHDR